jgi:hypothetical protein
MIQRPAAPQPILTFCAIHQVEMLHIRNNTYFCPECLGLK